MGRTKKTQSQQTKTILISSALVVLIAVGGFYLGKSQGWFGAGISTTVPAAAPTTVEFNVTDYHTNEEITDDVTWTWYRAPVSTLDDAEVANLAFSDFTAITDDEELKPDEDYVYVVKISMTDMCTRWARVDLRDDRTNTFAQGELIYDAQLGLNPISLVNETEDVSLLCYSTDGPFTTTIADTDYDTWQVVLACLDGSEGTTANITNEEGFAPAYDFENAVDSLLIIRIAFNTTADASFVSFLSEGFDVNEVVVNGANNYTYFEVNAKIDGISEFKIKFGATLGTSFEVVSIACGYGSAASSTIWDTQT